MNIGVLGGGQLGRMLGLAGIPLGHTFRFFDVSADVPAAAVGHVVVGDFADTAALHSFADGLDVITYEFENVPAESAHFLKKVVPDAQALRFSQDRLLEKQLFEKLGMQVPTYLPAENCSNADFDGILKTRRLGYDGKGQVRVEKGAQVQKALDTLNRAPSIFERRVDFKRELSLIGVRSNSKEVRIYPPIRNLHVDGILRLSFAPAAVIDTSAVAALMHELDYVGVLALELFDIGAGSLLANEFAPRVHNSGHWTIEGAECSQFENHIRAITGTPLGSVFCPAKSVMVNVIGTVPDTRKLAEISGVHLHLYGKAPRPGRKLGHITIVGKDSVKLSDTTAAVLECLEFETIREQCLQVLKDELK